MGNSFAFLQRMSWDPYGETKDLIPQAKKYKQKYGSYPERIWADRFYINIKKWNFCIRNDLRLSQAIGEATKDPEISAAYMRQLSADQGSETKLKDALD